MQPEQDQEPAPGRGAFWRAWALWALTIGRTPAFQPMMPGPATTVTALVITVAMAVVGASVARRLAEGLVLADRAGVEG